MPHQFEFLEDSLVEELFYRADKVKVDTIYCTTKILNGTVEINLSVVSIIMKLQHDFCHTDDEYHQKRVGLLTWNCDAFGIQIGKN